MNCSIDPKFEIRSLLNFESASGKTPPPYAIGVKLSQKNS